MLTLAFESSAKAASVALMRDRTLLAESFMNNGKTHSATLMPMAQQIMADCGVDAQMLDCVAVAAGPGSFTGIRIGVAAAKGLAWAAEKPVCPVSTLAGMAMLLQSVTGTVCAVMDARRSQVYNALFSANGRELQRITEDRAISLEELYQELPKLEGLIYLVGDGSRLCYETLSGKLPNLIMPSPALEMQRASGVAMFANSDEGAAAMTSCTELTPNYLRLSQAERERMERLKKAEEA